MSLIRLANGHKYEIEQPNEGEGMMRNRRRNTVQLTFRAGAEQFEAIRADITPENLDTFTIYYPTTKRQMNRTSSWPELRIRIFLHTPLWAIGRIKRSRNRKKPARPRLYTGGSYPLRSESDWQVIFSRREHDGLDNP